MATRLTAALRAFLEEPRFGVLATIDPDGLPHQSVIWYLLEDDTILMNTARGRVKERNLRRDARASLCVADGYRWVTLRGAVELIDDQTIAQADIARLAYHYQTPEAAERNIARFRTQQRVTLRLHIQQVLAEGFEA
ncbi:PPOX class F420-dependent oxidoreductase [Kallotenue papyrolyticum]|uniref:PPOX class F420-dependent oxidoreductase n=1 Tax=Kallotenue papyrolyticum TaxID=1325125 RepID=UPI00046ED249|nr:PPOX class F420-dependent oxidoreductase [Kallotenue papyrolyticum]